MDCSLVTARHVVGGYSSARPLLSKLARRLARDCCQSRCGSIDRDPLTRRRPESALRCSEKPGRLTARDDDRDDDDEHLRIEHRSRISLASGKSPAIDFRSRSRSAACARALGAISLAIPLKQMEKPADHDRVDPQPSRKSPRSAVHCRSRARKTTVTFSVER